MSETHTVSSEFIPQIPDDPKQGWQLIWQTIDQLRLQLERQALEIRFFQTQAMRTKSAPEYAEEAVAFVYGFTKYEFYGNRKLGRNTEQERVICEARFVLYTILHHVMGVPVADLRKNYDSNTYNYVDRWRPIFDLVHTTKPLTKQADRDNYDRYAPKYRAAYIAMRMAMRVDGVWSPEFDDPLF